MAEIQSRPSSSTRGRGSGRGGRGGLSSRGGRASTRSPNSNGDSSFEDEGEIGSLKKQYCSQIAQIREIFPDWSDIDLAFALQETSGDVDTTVTRIMEGSISQWGEVSSHKKHHGRAKAKESTLAPETAAPKPARGGRAEPGRGGRGRATERGGRGGGRARGASHVATNGSRHKENQALSIPTEKAWGDAAVSEGWGTDDTSKQAASTTKKPAVAPAATPATPKPAPVKTWASMLRQSTEPKPASKPVDAAASKPAEPIEPLPPAPTAEPDSTESEPTEPEPEPEPVAEPEPETEQIEEEHDKEPEPPIVVPTVIEPEVALPPSKDRLTETNLEQVADTSHPPATVTAASTTADSWDPHQNAPSTSATPVSASQQQHQTIAKVSAASASVGSGYAATAQKATERASRGPSHHQRRILDQEEAVRMPGHREVDRATVQFGAFNLGDAEEDIDEDREEAETRAQPPADSPVAHPRTSLPPVQPAPAPEAFQTSKPTAPAAPASVATIPTGPAAASTPIAAAPPTAPSGPAAVPTGPAGAPTQPAAVAAALQQPPQGPQQYGRFPQPGTQDQPGFPQKSYDSFAGQSAAPSNPQSQSPYESGLPAQAPQPQQGPIQQPTSGAFSSAPSDYPYYATSDQSNRGAPYNSYYNPQYTAQQQQQAGQGQAQGQQEGGLATQQQRGFGSYNPQNDNLSQYPQSSAQVSRFGAAAAAATEAQNSGNNTPNPTQTQPAPGQGAQAQSHAQQQSHGQFGGYNHPYYNSPYYSNFMYGQNNYGGNYGAGPYGKGGVYGQPHQYGMSPQGAPFDHSSSGNAGFGQGSLHRGDTGLSSGLGDYQRGGSTQMGSQPGLGGAGGFGGMHDTFGRGGGSGYPSQAGQGGYNAQGAQPGNAGTGADDLKPPYGDSKTTGGPSPSLSAAARPGSAANTAASQSGLPPPQSNQQGMGAYGGYPSHLQGQHGLHGNQNAASSGAGYGMGGGVGQGHGNSFPYGNQYGGQSYYGNQQQRGWGGNYH